MTATMTSDYDPVATAVELLRADGRTVVKQGTGWVAQCPAHDDRNPSLSVGRGKDGRVLLHCHAGCSPRDILDGIGLDPQAMFMDYDPSRVSSGNIIHVRAWNRRQESPRPPKPTRRVKTHHWDYLWPDGRPAARVVRYDVVDKETGEIVGKTFTQHKIDDDGTVLPNLDGMDMPLYHAPEIAAAIKADLPVIAICEGEKDADTATSLGLVATTCAQGAGSWRPHHTATLAGASNVTIIADNDAPGTEHAMRVREQLVDAGISVRIVRPKQGKDLTDHVAAGFGLTDLAPYDEQAAEDDRVREVKERFPALDWHALWADESEEEWIVEPLLPARRLVALYSAPKLGKSLLMLELAAAISRGDQVLGYTPARPYRVLYVDFENDPKIDTRDRLKAMGYRPDQLDNLVVLSFPSMSTLDTPAGAEELMACIGVYEVEVVIVDTVSRTIKGDENENDTWLRFYRNTGLAVKQAGVSLIRLDHTGKDETKGQRGGSAKSGDVDAIWRLSRVTETTFKLECDEARLPIVEKVLVLHREQSPRLHHRVDAAGSAGLWRTRVDDAIALLDANGIPDDASTRTVEEFKRERGVRWGSKLIREVVKQRKGRVAAWQ